MHELRKSITTGKANDAASLLAGKSKERTAKAGSLGSVRIEREQARATHQRGEDRFSSSAETAQASWRNQTHQLKVRNISSSGIQLESDLPANIGETVLVSLADCEPINCHVRWVRDGRIGLEFAAETQVLAEAGVVNFIIENIESALSAAGDQTAQSVGVEKRETAQRHGLVWLASLRIGKSFCTARLRNISATGAMVHWEGDANPAQGDHVSLDLGRAGKASGIIKWCAGNEAGIAFDENFDVAGLVNQRAADVDILKKEGDDAADLNVDERVGRAMRNYDPPSPFAAVDETPRLTLEELYATLYPDGRPEESSETDLAG